MQARCDWRNCFRLALIGLLFLGICSLAVAHNKVVVIPLMEDNVEAPQPRSYAYRHPDGLPSIEVSAPDLPGAINIKDIYFELPESAGTIGDLNIFLAIETESNDSLDITLTHIESRVTRNLFSDIGHNRNGLAILLDDGADTDIGDIPAGPDQRGIFGHYNIESDADLTLFNGLDASGEWRLRIANDDHTAGPARLYAWILVIEPTEFDY